VFLTSFLPRNLRRRALKDSIRHDTRVKGAIRKHLKDLIAEENIITKSRWNNSVFHFSDGDNWPQDNPGCKALIAQLLDHAAVVGYGEIRYRAPAIYHHRHQEDVYQALQTLLVKKEGMGSSPVLGNAAFQVG
jgi:uncharacterized sporulation protein YeaH/YhbH (DUF444 family)